MKVLALDHLVLTVRDVDRTIDFYFHVLGMEPVEFGQGRRALRFGQQKINLHQAGREFEPKAATPLPGSADLCFVIDSPIEQAVDQLDIMGIELLEGPVQRIGATGVVDSVYLRDPDGNLVELSCYRNVGTD